MKHQLRIIRERGLALGVADSAAVTEVGNAGSTWSLSEGKPFMQRVHDSFNSIGEMFIFTICAGVSTERQEEFRNFLQSLFHCQEKFYVWYEGAENKSYDPAVAAFLALRAILDSSVEMLSGFPDRLQTVGMLQKDIDEIVGKMQAEMVAQPQTTTGHSDTDTQQALLQMQTVIAGL